MNMIKVTGNYKVNRLRLLSLPVIVAVLLIGDKLIGNYMNIVCAVMIVLLLLFGIIFIVMEFAPMEVSFDRYWLMTKQLIFKKDIKMEDVSQVRYYIQERPNEGRKDYYLILEIDYSGGKMKLQEKIKKEDIEYCKEGKGFEELFILYRFFEAEWPKKTKGYRRFCGF